MTKQQLIDKLNDLEWEDFEVKAAKGQVPKSSWETVSAFSNTAGGWLVFGVEQNNQKFIIDGLNNPEKIEQDFLGTLRGKQKFNISINPTCKKYSIDGKVVLAFYIPVSKYKPVYYNKQINTYLRRGSADQKATQEEIDSLYRDQTFGTKTSEIAPRSSSKDLHNKSIREYREYISRFNPSVSYNRKDKDDILKKLRVIDLETNTCTFAGLLFFGKRASIEKYFPDFRIDLLEVPGTSYKDAPSRYTYRLQEDDYENLWDVYFECFRRLQKEVDISYKLTADGFGEELSPGLKSIREALVNMLMHADYFSPAHPRIRIFTNHIEFYNPGGFPKPLEELKGKDLSIPRNPILAKLFRMVRLAENAGYGLDNIENNWKEYNGTAVEYNIDFDSSILKFKTKIETPIEDIKRDKAKVEGVNEGVNEGVKLNIEGVNEGVNKELNNLYFKINLTPGKKASELSKEINKGLSTTERYLKILKEKGFVEFKGAPKTGGYYLIKNNPIRKK